MSKEDKKNKTYGSGTINTTNHADLYFNAPKNTHCFFYIDYNRPNVEISLRMNDHVNVIKFLLIALKRMTDSDLNKISILDFINICRGNGFDYPEFAAIEKSLGSLKEAAHPNARHLFTFALKNGDFACCTFINNKDYFEVSIPDNYNWVDYSETLKREPFTKENVIKFLLKMLKEDSEVIQFQRIIAFLRSEGHNWPELAAIEKSLKSKLKEGTSEDGIPIYDGDDRHIVKFKDKEAFLKLCLQELRNGSVSDVKHWIDMCKECGFNYPEFEAIEKSIRAL